MMQFLCLWIINRFILSGWILPRNVRTCGGITYVHGRRRGILGVEHTVGGQEVCYAWSFHRGQVSASECHLISLTGIPSSGFPKLTRFLAHHDKIIAKFIPKLKKHFDQYNLDSILYSLKWFFVVFIERVSTGSQKKLRKNRTQMERRLNKLLLREFLARTNNNKTVYPFLADTVQPMFTRLGCIPSGRGESCYCHGLHHITFA